jgi:DNA-binding response OmpR family regulator
MTDTILVIDDDRAIAHLTVMWVAAAGFRAIEAFDGRSGLATAAAQQPGLILLDIRMPDLDGFEVYRRLRQTQAAKDTPVIFLSAHAQEAARREALDLGARFFLSKPFESADLIAAVRACLTTPQPESIHAT